MPMLSLMLTTSLNQILLFFFLLMFWFAPIPYFDTQLNYKLWSINPAIYGQSMVQSMVQYHSITERYKLIVIQFSQFEIPFSAFSVSLCVLFILPAGRHAMLLQCTNMYARTNTKYNTKYNLFGLGSLRDDSADLQK